MLSSWLEATNHDNESYTDENCLRMSLHRFGPLIHGCDVVAQIMNDLHLATKLYVCVCLCIIKERI